MRSTTFGYSCFFVATHFNFYLFTVILSSAWIPTVITNTLSLSLLLGVTTDEEGRAGRTFVRIRVCEGMGMDERAGSVVFSLLAKLRRFALIVEAQIDIYIATLSSILILNNVGINEF